MDREKLQQDFCKGLEELGFKKANSLDRRISTYIKTGGTIAYHDNYRTEVNVDYYGFTIVYKPTEHVRYKKIISWTEWGGQTAAAAFYHLFRYFGLVKPHTDGSKVFPKSRLKEAVL